MRCLTLTPTLTQTQIPNPNQDPIPLPEPSTLTLYRNRNPCLKHNANPYPNAFRMVVTRLPVTFRVFALALCVCVCMCVCACVCVCVGARLRAYVRARVCVTQPHRLLPLRWGERYPNLHPNPNSNPNPDLITHALSHTHVCTHTHKRNTRALKLKRLITGKPVSKTGRGNKASSRKAPSSGEGEVCVCRCV